MLFQINVWIQWVEKKMKMLEFIHAMDKEETRYANDKSADLSEGTKFADPLNLGFLLYYGQGNSN